MLSRRLCVSVTLVAGAFLWAAGGPVLACPEHVTHEKDARERIAHHVSGGAADGAPANVLEKKS